MLSLRALCVPLLLLALSALVVPTQAVAGGFSVTGFGGQQVAAQGVFDLDVTDIAMSDNAVLRARIRTEDGNNVDAEFDF